MCFPAFDHVVAAPYSSQRPGFRVCPCEKSRSEVSIASHWIVVFFTGLCDASRNRVAWTMPKSSCKGKGLRHGKGLGIPKRSKATSHVSVQHSNQNSANPEASTPALPLTSNHNQLITAYFQSQPDDERVELSSSSFLIGIHSTSRRWKLDQ